MLKTERHSLSRDAKTSCQSQKKTYRCERSITWRKRRTSSRTMIFSMVMKSNKLGIRTKWISEIVSRWLGIDCLINRWNRSKPLMISMKQNSMLKRTLWAGSPPTHKTSFLRLVSEELTINLHWKRWGAKEIYP
jgi:hypothetical protein